MISSTDFGILNPEIKDMLPTPSENLRQNVQGDETVGLSLAPETHDPFSQG